MIKIVKSLKYPYRNRETYLALFNTSETPGLELKVNLADLNLAGKVKVTNLWSGEKLGVHKDTFAQSIVAHGSGLFKLSSPN